MILNDNTILDIPEENAWAEAEAEFERFLGDHDQIDVLTMTRAEYDAWKVNYARLYRAVFDAQIAYYNLLMGVTP